MSFDAEEDDNNSVSVQSSPPAVTNVSQPKMNESWFGKPMEEVDEFVFEDTFCVISKKLGKNYVYRYSCDKSLFLLGPLHPIRQAAICITTHRWFDIFIICTILANCTTLGMITNEFNPGTVSKRLDDDKTRKRERIIASIEYGFLGIYTLELILKVMAKGFALHKFSYLRNRWNILDTIVVVAGFLTIIIPDDNEKENDNSESLLDFLKTLRVLRVIKTVSIIPGLKMLINTLISSIVHLLEVLGLILVCLVIFSVFAVEMFQGVLLQKCVIDKGGDMDPDKLVNQRLSTIADKDTRDQEWSKWTTDWKNFKRRDFPEDEPTQCGNDSDTRPCGDGYTCLGLMGGNPNDGWVSFDNFFLAMLSCFQLLTADYWERLYDLIVSTVGLYSVIFFIIMIFVGSYSLLNLLLAVVALSYDSESALQKLEDLSASERLLHYRQKSNFSFDDLAKLNICRMTHYKKRTKSEQEKLALMAKHGKIKDGDRAIGHFDDANIILNLNLMGLRLKKNADMEQHPSDISISMKWDHQSSMIPAPTMSETARARSERQPRNTMFFMEAPAPLGQDDTPLGLSPSDVEVSLERVAVTRNARQSIAAVQAQFTRKIKSWAYPIVIHRWFERTITAFIILNTIALACEHHGSPDWLEYTLRVCNYILIAVFTAECILKLMGFQNLYFKSGWNIFDLLILIVTYADMALVQSKFAAIGISVLRSMRLLRVFKLARSWMTMKVLLNIIFASVGNLGNLTLLLMIIIYVFAVMGMQVIGGEYCPGAFDAVHNTLRFPRWNWKHFWYAFMMVFRVLCGEWIEPLRECLKAQEFYIKTQENASPFLSYLKCFSIFMPILIVGNFIVFNLFLAMLLNSFDTEELNAQLKKETEARVKAESMKNIIELMMAQKHKEKEEEEEEEHEVKLPEAPTSKVSEHSSQKADRSIKPSSSRIHETRARKRWRTAIHRVIMYNRIDAAVLAISRAENNMKRRNCTISNRLFLRNPGERSSTTSVPHDTTPELSDSDMVNSGVGRECCPQQKLQWIRWVCCRKRPLRRKTILQNSLYNKSRSLSVHIVSHPAFEYFILLLIFGSSISLCFEDVNLEGNKELQQILCIINIVLTGLFFLEMILKWLAIGLWGYFTSFWTVLDGFIVAVSLVSIYFDVTEGTCHGKGTSNTKHHLGALKVLRTVRALRPLRAISRWEGMRIVVNSLLHAIPAIFNVLLVCLLVWLIFSIMAVQFFKGKFYRCVDNEGENLDPRVVPNRAVCCSKTDTHDYSWVNTISNYDNVLEGYLSLFQVATFEGWMELMSFSVDAVGVDRQPNMNNQIEFYAFYVAFIIIGSFFALKLFTGVIIDKFNMLKKRYEGSMNDMLLTPQQRFYYIAMRNLARRKPRPLIKKPTMKLRSFFYYIALSKWLEVLVLTLTLLNVCVEAFKPIEATKARLHVLSAVNSFFAVIYFVEATVKILGLGAFYFTVPWNVYDLILVLASVMEVYFDAHHDMTMIMPIPPTMMRVVRVLRVGRILRSVKAAQGLRKLLFALTISLPALFNIGALLALITFIYAILGMTVFGKAPQKWSIDEVYSFKTFRSSCLILLRLMTLAGWNEILDSLTVVYPLCGSYRHLPCNMAGEPECPDRWLVVAYIVTYLILCNQIMINLFIAIILENYVEASDEEDIGIVEDDVEMFYIRWSKYDPDATQFINFDDLSDFLNCLNPPLQVPKPNALAIGHFNLPITRGNKIHCLDILKALITRVMGPAEETPEFKKVQRKLEHKLDLLFPHRELLDIVSSTRQWKKEWKAAVVIQRAWRRYRANTKQTESDNSICSCSSLETASLECRRSLHGDSETHGGWGHAMKKA